MIGDAANIFLGWPFPGTKTRIAKRDLWTPDHLHNLFNSDYWKGANVTSAIHWLPLIALHSGLRVDEIANILVPQDIGNENGIMFFNIQEHGTEAEAFDETTETWRTKTEAGIRRVPVHTWLIGHGIQTLFDFRRKQKAGLLFPELKPSGPDGKLSAAYSREFSRQKIALNIPEKIVFHCFRTTFRHTVAQSRFSDVHLDAVTGHEGAKVPSRHVDALTGDAGEDRGVGAVYERPKEFALQVLRDVVESFQPPLDLSFIAPVKPPMGSKRAPA
jgi:integrase